MNIIMINEDLQSDQMTCNYSLNDFITMPLVLSPS